MVGPRAQRRDGVAGDREHLDTVVLEVFEGVADLAQFAGADAREGEGVEDHGHVTVPPPGCRADLLAVLVGKGEVWGDIPDLSATRATGKGSAVITIDSATRALARLVTARAGPCDSQRRWERGATSRCRVHVRLRLATPEGCRPAATAASSISPLHMTVLIGAGARDQAAAVDEVGQRVDKDVDQVSVIGPEPDEDAVGAVIVALVLQG